MTTFTLQNEDGYPSFVLTTNKLEEHYVDFTLVEVVAWTEHHDIADTQQYMKGTIKWDGCSHVYVGEDANGYMHLCGKQDWIKFSDVILWVYEVLTPHIKSYNKDVAE